MEQVYYRSTRGNVNGILSSEAIVKGIAEDGGLYVPDSIPEVYSALKDLKKLDYKELAYYIMSKFFTDFKEDELKECIENAYNEKFDNEDIAPVKKVGDIFFLELYHGPTLAFKDMALSILPYLLKTAVKKLNIVKNIVILTATSGDTGKAALEGFTDIEGIKIIVFYPIDGVSEIQKRQMICHIGSNTYVYGINGNFDDTQNGVKDIFADKEFVKLLDEKNYLFSSANSINIGRLVPQIVYYFHAYLNMCNRGEIEKGDKINFVVPTGNFGNILAAYYAKEMGLPINKLICASNDNKVLYDFISTGVYDKSREFITTISPSMDILISSNLERLLYLISGQDSHKTKELMELLISNGNYEITPYMKERLEDFYGGFASEMQTREAIKNIYEKSNYLMDTHTAVAYCVYKKYIENTKDTTKTVIVSTASPYKFTSAVMSSIDEKYSNLDDFELINEMSIMCHENAPLAIKYIKDKQILHTKVYEKSGMRCAVEDALNM